MNLLGYSERGFLNALLYDCFQDRVRGRDLIRDVLALARWPLRSGDPEFLHSARCDTILIEQSLSDFGDSDGILLFDSDVGNSTVFVEAKRGRNWRLGDEWDRFEAKFCGAPDEHPGYGHQLSSNLFCQLYFKQRFAAALAEDNDLAVGLEFDGPLRRGRNGGLRKIGKNPVVLRSVHMIQPFVRSAYYLMVIPQDWDDGIADLLRRINQVATPPRNWDLSNWGVLTIPQVREFCETRQLHHTLSVIEFNREQL